jgi:hypothetical protein
MASRPLTYGRALALGRLGTGAPKVAGTFLRFVQLDTDVEIVAGFRKPLREQHSRWRASRRPAFVVSTTPGAARAAGSRRFLTEQKRAR